MESITATALVANGTTSLAPDDESRIRAVLENFDRIWNEHRISELGSLFTDDAELVNVVGMWWRGRADIIRALEAFHATMFRNHQLSEANVVIRQIAPKVVIAMETEASSAFTTLDGILMKETRNRLTWVLLKRNESWLITSMHSTVVDPEAQKNNPIQP